jgi:hypothetical protein
METATVKQERIAQIVARFDRAESVGYAVSAFAPSWKQGKVGGPVKPGMLEGLINAIIRRTDEALASSNADAEGATVELLVGELDDAGKDFACERDDLVPIVRWRAVDLGAEYAWEVSTVQGLADTSDTRTITLADVVGGKSITIEHFIGRHGGWLQ